MPAKISNLERVQRRLQKEFDDFAGDGARVTGFVGYSAPYAIYVHENMEIDHPLHVDGSGSVRDCKGQAKFLEIPAREILPTVAGELAKMKRNKKGLRYSIQTILDRILRESRKLVPWMTGNLYRSGFTRLTIRDAKTGRFRR